MVDRYTIPLLHDHHTHVTQYAALIDCLNLQDVMEKDEALCLIGERDEEPVVVLGWDSSRYTLTKEDIDGMGPVLVCNRSLHGFVMNDACREYLKDDYPDFVKNIDDDNWLEMNLSRVLRTIAKIEGVDIVKLDRYFDSLLENGVWSAEDMLLIDEETLWMLDGSEYSGRVKLWADLDVFQGFSEEGRDKLEGVKLFTDGALGSWTAAMNGEFKNGSSGILLHTDEELEDMISGLCGEVDKIAIHAIGGRAIDQVVRVVEGMDGDIPSIRMEHAAFISEETAREALDLGITLCMQPNFSFNSVEFRDRLADEILEKNNPFRMLIDDVGYVPGDNLIFGSDGMPHGVDYAVRSVFFPPLDGQKLSMDEFAAGYCLEDESKGEIEVGMDREQKEIETSIKSYP